MGFLPSRVCGNTTVWMHHMDANKTHGKKAKQKLHVMLWAVLTDLGSNTL